MEKKIIKLDLTGCKYISEVHERIRVAFDFQEWYGANWSAFWDLLWSECDADEVLIYGEHTLPKSFERDIQWMHFSGCMKSWIVKLNCMKDLEKSLRRSGRSLIGLWIKEAL